MPVKTRRTKRRTSEGAELARWETLFTFGFDYFGDLPFASDTEARAAAVQAWQRLGGRFLASWTESPSRAVPWAVEAFGCP